MASIPLKIEDYLLPGRSLPLSDYIPVPRDAPFYVKYDPELHGSQTVHFKLLDDLEKQIALSIEACNDYNLQHYSEILYTRIIQNGFLISFQSLLPQEVAFYERAFCIYIISLFHLKRYSQILTRAAIDYWDFFLEPTYSNITILNSMYTAIILHYCALSMKCVTKLKIPLGIVNNADYLWKFLTPKECTLTEAMMATSCIHLPKAKLNSLDEDELQKLNFKIKNDTKIFGAPDLSSYFVSLADYYSLAIKFKPVVTQPISPTIESPNAESLLNLSLIFNPFNIEALEKVEKAKLMIHRDADKTYNFREALSLQKYVDSQVVNEEDVLKNSWDFDYLTNRVYQLHTNFHQNNFYATKEIMESDAFKLCYYSQPVMRTGYSAFAHIWHNNYNMIYYYLKSLVEVYEFDLAYAFIRHVFDFAKNEIPLYDCEDLTSAPDYMTETYNLISVLMWQCYKTTGDMKYLLLLKDMIMFFSVRSENDKVYCMIALALMYSCLDQTDKTIALLKKTYMKHPSYAYTYYLLGNEFMVKEEFAEAIQAFRICLSQGYKSYKVYYSTGVAYLMLGEYQEAIKQLSQGLHVNRVNIILLNTYGIVLEKVGNEKDAQTYFKLVLELYDDYNETNANSGSNVFRENYVNIALFKVADYKFNTEHDVKGALNLLSRFDNMNVSSGGGKYDSTLVNIYSLLEKIHESLGDTKASIAFKNRVVSLDPVGQGLNL